MQHRPVKLTGRCFYLSVFVAVMLQHGVGYVAVRNNLDRAVIVLQLLLGYNIRVVAVDRAVTHTMLLTTLVIVPMSCDTITIAIRRFNSISIV